jgi:hypothetical protein
MAKTPAAQPPQQGAPPVVSPHAQTGAAAAESQKAQASSGHSAPPQAVSADVVERVRNAPRVADPARKGRGSTVGYTTDHAAHEQAWRMTGGHGDSPPAFIYDNQIYLDPTRWPAPTP